MKPYQIVISSLVLLSNSIVEAQQVVVLSPTEGQILAHTYSQKIATGQLKRPAPPFSSERWSAIPIKMGAAGATGVQLTNGTSSFRINDILFRLTDVGGVVPNRSTVGNLVSISGLQTIYSPPAVNSPAAYGNVNMTYTIPDDVMNRTAFAAGYYDNTSMWITHNVNYVGVLGGIGYRYVDPAQIPIRLYIPAINRWVASNASYSKTYTALTEFTTSLSDLIFDLSSFTIAHTVPTFIDIMAKGAITFTPDGGGAASSIPVDIVKAFGTGLRTVPLSTRLQGLKETPGIAIVAGNVSNSPLKLKINSADVATYLFKAGTYTFAVDIRTRDVSALLRSIKTVNFSITTPPMGSISIQNNGEILFNYSSETDYRANKSVNINNQLLISNNKSFSVYVRSNSAQFLLRGNPTTIPCSIVSLENGTGETGITPRTLSTRSQSIINAAAPALKRSVSLKYTISARNAANYLLGKQPNLYQLVIIYSFTAR